MEFSLFAIMAVAALVLDKIFAEVGRFHPLVGVGNLANWLESSLNVALNDKKRYNIVKILGVIAVIIIVIPGFLLSIWLSSLDYGGLLFQVLLLYFVLGAESLFEHGEGVVKAMEESGLDGARLSVGMIVSRDVGAMSEAEVASSTIESLLENGCDAVFAALFWFMLFGAPGAVLYRLVNTLDAMWGYRTERYIYFGWGAARLDDLLNYIPARLTAVTYLLLGNSRSALRSWLECKNRKSPNATLVMATGAGGLEIKLGGESVYNGVVKDNPVMGLGRPPVIGDIPRAVLLVRRGVLLWFVGLLFIGVFGVA
ncbi:MAG: cobalamin biosynthesis protein CobD [Magnetococcales bacterium]|nr:cobalamin biosynthesis protein CobD [Magnetococcales bacterium]